MGGMEGRAASRACVCRGGGGCLPIATMPMARGMVLPVTVLKSKAVPMTENSIGCGKDKRSRTISTARESAATSRGIHP